MTRLPAKSTSPQRSRATSWGQIPAYSISPTVGRQIPPLYARAACTSCSASSGVRIGTVFSTTRGASTRATGFSMHQPRFHCRGEHPAERQPRFLPLPWCLKSRSNIRRALRRRDAAHPPPLQPGAALHEPPRHIAEIAERPRLPRRNTQQALL